MEKDKNIKLAYCMLGIYGSGGHQRITAAKMNYLVDRGYEVYLITSSQAGRPFFYELDPRIKHLDLDIRHDLYESLPRFRAHRERFRKLRLHRKRLEQVLMEIRPDITIVPGYYENQFAYKIKDGSIKVIEHHSTKYWNVYLYRSMIQSSLNPSLWMRLNFGLRGLWGYLMTAKYSWCDRHYDVLVLLTEAERESFKWHPRTEVIPNPKSLELGTPSSLSEKVVLSVGQLVPSKNFGELIAIWSEVVKGFPDWKLRILGGGYMQEALEGRIKQLGLEGQAELVGEVSDVAPYYLSSSLCASTSLYEGFSLFLAEGAEAGLPLLSYDCPTGPGDIIQEGKNGYLVELGDRATFVARLREMLSNAELRRSMGKAARESAERYAPERVMKAWDELFTSLVAERSHTTP